MNTLVSELANRKTQLSETRSQLTNCQLDLASTLELLIDFQSRYSSALSTLYQKLDQLHLEISNLTAEKTKMEIPVASECQLDNAYPSSAVTTTTLIRVSSTTSSKDYDESALIRLFRLAARTLHPDFAMSEHERQLRCRAMAEVNSAYDMGDIETIRQILELWTSDSKGTVSGAKPDELNYVIKQLAFAKRALIRVQEELSQLKSSQWHLLFLEEKKLKAKGKDLIAMLANEAKRDLSKAKRVLQSMTKGTMTYER